MVEDGGLWQRQKWKQSNFGFGIYKGVFGMTRREEIEQKALSKYPQGTNRYNKFIEGAKWADKTMIEKATQWLQNTLYEVATGLINRPDVVSIESTTMDDFINNFRKAMEE